MQVSSISSRLQRVIDHCAALARRSEILFVSTVAGISVALSLAAGYGLELLQFQQPEQAKFARFGALGFLVIAVFLAPVLETFLLQQLPIVLGRRFGLGTGLQFAMGSVPFAVTHFESGVISGVAAGIVGGAVCSIVFLTFVNERVLKAFWMTAAVHSLHNLIIVGIFARDLPT